MKIFSEFARFVVVSIWVAIYGAWIKIVAQMADDELEEIKLRQNELEVRTSRIELRQAHRDEKLERLRALRREHEPPPKTKLVATGSQLQAGDVS
ncbi:MAG: hypothetical protein NT077_00275 [Candidatus Taylorbacteria bacterium]|nr:hypothetical protein [Candidatus Taylorbacteria bacterium]